MLIPHNPSKHMIKKPVVTRDQDIEITEHIEAAPPAKPRTNGRTAAMNARPPA